MKAPEREYRYRLFSTPDVNCGQEVVDFINRHSGGAISFEFDDQPVGGPEWGPVDEEDVVWSFEVATLFADSFGVLLTEEFTSTPVIQESEYAIVGRRATGVEPDGGPDVPFLAYYCIVAIFNHELAKLLPNQFPTQLRQVGPFTWAKFAASGSLPFPTPDSLQKVRDKGSSLKLFLFAVDAVLLAISLEYPEHVVSSIAELDISQQAAREHVEKELPSEDSQKNKPDLTRGPIGAKVAAAASEYGTPEDALGYETYANALGDLIVHPKTETPLAIAICAKWGMGKTTLMNYVKDRLDKVSAETGEKYGKIDFNAWKYSKSEAIWAAFYSVILKSIETALGPLEKLSFRSFVARKTHPGWYFSWWLGAIVFFSLFFTLGYILFFSPEPPPAEAPEYQVKEIITVIENEPTADSTATLVIRQPKPGPEPFLSLGSLSLKELIAIITGLVTLVSTLWGPLRSLSRGILGKVRKGGADLRPLTQSDVVNYVDNVKEWLERKFERDKTMRMNKLPKRFVIFVDDIDRVEPNKVMQMMEAIKLFLETPRFVFVLAMDAKVVRRAIGEHYSFMAETSEDREKLGHDYLEKIIQIPFYLPKIARGFLDRLGDRLLKESVEPSRAGAQQLPPDTPSPTQSDSADKEPDEPVKPKPEVTGTQEPGEQADDEVAPTAAAAEPATVDDKLEMELSDDEKQALGQLFMAGMKMSPRQIVRYRNVYLLARHIYLRRFPDKPSPPTEFTKWIALSVRYPFEIRELVRICFDADWSIGWQTVFYQLADELAGDDRWEKMRRGDLIELAALLSDHVPEAQAVNEFIIVTNCFNLVLD